MNYPPKSESVDVEGNADGFQPPMTYQRQTLLGGYTRFEISVPASKASILHRRLIEGVSTPCKVRYVKLTDRASGQLEKPESYVAVEVQTERILEACKVYPELLYHDARHQIWIRGANEEMVVIDELGMLYAYPADFGFSDILDELGWQSLPDFVEGHPLKNSKQDCMSTRDYVKVNFIADADAQEQAFLQSFGMVRWDG